VSETASFVVARNPDGDSMLPYLLRIAVEGGIEARWRPRVTAVWPCEVVAQLQVRYPGVPIVCADWRKLAEDWTHRFLAAAAAHHR
jgi:hypothetical protein